MDVVPPPESNSVERLTVAIRLLIVRPSRRVPSGMAVCRTERFALDRGRAGQERVHGRRSRRRSSWAPRAGPARGRRCRARRRARSRPGRSWSRRAMPRAWRSGRACRWRRASGRFTGWLGRRLGRGRDAVARSGRQVRAGRLRADGGRGDARDGPEAAGRPAAGRDERDDGDEAPVARRRGMGFMGRAPGWERSGAQHPPGRSRSRRRAVTIRSQAAGARSAGRRRRGWPRSR